MLGKLWAKVCEKMKKNIEKVFQYQIFICIVKIMCFKFLGYYYNNNVVTNFKIKKL